MWNFDWLLPSETDSTAADEWLNSDAVFQFDGADEDSSRFLSSLTSSHPPNVLEALSASPEIRSAQPLPQTTPIPIKSLPQQQVSAAPPLPASSSAAAYQFELAKLHGTKEPVDDKRKRNTAASARFRAKKKLKEMALEKTAQEMVARAEMLERRLCEYEMEIKWLRQLVTEQIPEKKLRDIYAEHNVNYIEQAPAAGSGIEQAIVGNYTPILPAPTSSAI
ncbi:hypothetical protein HDU67_000701 [Dinochytrium kinnereticum]|nr:hypothetical protein HDU67_000701 [Dinochytrium kinnereticum]